MVRIYVELSPLIALANEFDVFHTETANFVYEITHRGFELVSSREAVEMDLAIGVAKRPLRVLDALRIIDSIDAHGIKLLDAQLTPVLSLVEKYLREIHLNMGDLLHYASATLLSADYLVSWNTDHFNPRFEEAINRVNRRRKLKTIRVGVPLSLIHI